MKLLVRSAAVIAASFFAALSARAALMPGDLAIIAWIDNGSPDSFAFVPLVDLPAGEIIYFTDNGWTGTGYRGVATNDGDGNETLTKFQTVNAIPAGTIIASSGASTDFTWTTTGLVPMSGVGTATFAPLSLSTTGEQIYAVQNPSAIDPLIGATALFLLDDTGGFENATSSATGAVPPGLTAGSTAVSFSAATFGAANYIAFKTNTLTSGTKSEWLAAIDDPANWTLVASPTTIPALPSGTIAVVPVPEPGTAGLLFGGIALLVGGRRRKLAGIAHGLAGIGRSTCCERTRGARPE